MYTKGLFLLAYEITCTYFVEDEYTKCLQLLYLIVKGKVTISQPNLFLEEIMGYGFDELVRTRDVIGIFYVHLIDLPFN